MGQLPVDEAPRNDSYDPAAGGQGRVSHRAHQADGRAAVDETDPVRAEQGAEAGGRRPILGSGADTGAAENADSAKRNVYHPLARPPIAGIQSASSRSRS